MAVAKNETEILEFVMDWIRRNEMLDLEDMTPETRIWNYLDSLDTLELVFDLENFFEFENDESIPATEFKDWMDNVNSISEFCHNIRLQVEDPKLIKLNS